MRGAAFPARSPGSSTAALLPILLVLLLVGGCRGSGDGESLPGSVEIGVTPTPPVVGPALLVVRIRDEAGVPVEGARVEVEGTMSHAGMVPVHESAEATAPGEYRVAEFEFTMGGDWILRAHVTLSDGVRGVHEETVRVVSGPPPSEGP